MAFKKAEIEFISNPSGESIVVTTGETEDLTEAPSTTYATMAEAMVAVMEFLDPNQLHTVAAYLELKAEQDEKTSFRAVYGG